MASKSRRSPAANLSSIVPEAAFSTSSSFSTALRRAIEIVRLSQHARTHTKFPTLPTAFVRFRAELARRSLDRALFEAIIADQHVRKTQIQGSRTSHQSDRVCRIEASALPVASKLAPAGDAKHMFLVSPTWHRTAGKRPDATEKLSPSFEAGVLAKSFW